MSAGAILTRKMQGVRSVVKRGRGKRFEQEIADAALSYERARLLILRKVDPPTRIVGRGRIVFLANPFLDFVGVWIEREGKAVFLEAKETSSGQLGLGQKTNGVTAPQLRSLRVWHHAGAVSAVLWRVGSATFLLPITEIDRLSQEHPDVKHIKREWLSDRHLCERNRCLSLLDALRRFY
jgi:hypothetical protein